MDNDSKKCFRCAFFRKYYVMGLKKFNETKFGLCSKSGTSVKNIGCCEEFRLKRFRRAHIDSLGIQLNNLLTEISVLRQILEEEIKYDDKV